MSTLITAEVRKVLEIPASHKAACVAARRGGLHKPPLLRARVKGLTLSSLNSPNPYFITQDEISSQRAFDYLERFFDYKRPMEWTPLLYDRAVDTFLHQGIKINLRFLVHLFYEIARRTIDPLCPTRWLREMAQGDGSFDITSYQDCPKTKVLVILKTIIARRLKRLDRDSEIFEILFALYEQTWTEYTVFPMMLEQRRSEVIARVLGGLPTELVENIKSLCKIM